MSNALDAFQPSTQQGVNKTAYNQILKFVKLKEIFLMQSFKIQTGEKVNLNF